MSKHPSEGSESAVDDIPTPSEAPNVDIDEDECFADKAILYRFCDEKSEWVTRGSGVLKVLRHKETGVSRILMRQNQTYVVRANHQIPYLGALTEAPGSNRQFFWTAFDFSTTEEIRELFAVRFALPAIAAAFKTAFEGAQVANRALIDN
jgi:Ran-binding protein 1